MAKNGNTKGTFFSLCYSTSLSLTLTRPHSFLLLKRSAARPLFRHNNLQLMVPVFTKESALLLEKINDAAVSGTALDLQNLFMVKSPHIFLQRRFNKFFCCVEIYT